MDEGAILACMAYVDLNPVRAGFAQTPEGSEFTSIYDRIISSQAKKALKKQLKKPTQAQKKRIAAVKQETKRATWLCPVEGIKLSSERSQWTVDCESYLELVDWTGRCIREGKRGSIPVGLAPVLDRLELDHEHWVDSVQHYGSLYYRIAGNLERLAEAAVAAGQKWFRGVESSNRVYQAA